MTKYKLYYFDFQGRAEFIRLMFHYANVPFEDVTFAFEDWEATWKPSKEFIYGADRTFVRVSLYLQKPIRSRSVRRVKAERNGDD